jgi:hypothetical protein
MKRTKLLGVMAIVMALTIAFSGVAVASLPATKGTETIDITTDIVCSGTVVESQRLSLESDSVDLINNIPLDAGEKYGKIGYDEKMIGSSGNTNFCKEFKVDTGTAPNLYVLKQIGYTQGGLGSLSHHEQVGMKIIAAGKTTTKTTTIEHICAFDEPETTTKTTKVPGSCEEVHVYSEMVVTDVEAETQTQVGIIDTVEPVKGHLLYTIDATMGDRPATGLVVAGVELYVADGIGGTDSTLGSRMSYKEKSIAYGTISNFCKKIDYTSKLPPPT